MSQDATGLAHVFLIQPNGSVTTLSQDQIPSSPHSDALLWLHLDLRHSDAQDWLEQGSGLDRLETDALLAEATRPRFTLLPHGMLLNLRGLDSIESQETDDTVSVRCWFEEHRVITASRSPSRAVSNLALLMKEGGHLQNASGLASFLAEFLVEDIGHYVDSLEEELDALSEKVEVDSIDTVRDAIHHIQRNAIALRRYIAPQQLALSQFAESEIEWLSERARRRLMESANEVARLVEALNFIWERARITHDDIQIRSGSETNRRLYLLSILSAIFLPLTFVTGLLGVNVGGIPGASAENAFWILCVLMLVLACGFGFWMRKSRWF